MKTFKVAGHRMEEAANKPSPIPAEICGYSVASRLSEQGSFLAIGELGRGLVLKKLDAECLLRGLLHPSIRDRLARVRELAHRGVANLHGVAREGADAYAIWEHLDGVPFDQYMTDRARSPRELAVAARELVLAVSSLHLQGIVHGALVAGNIIVSDTGLVRLTHVSPLLYTDSAVDDVSVRALLSYVFAQRQETDTPIGRLCSAAEAENLPLRDLGVRLAAIIESRDFETPAAAASAFDSTPRRRSLVGAALVALTGIGIAAGVWLTVAGNRLELPRSFHLPQFVDRAR